MLGAQLCPNGIRVKRHRSQVVRLRFQLYHCHRIPFTDTRCWGRLRRRGCISLLALCIHLFSEPYLNLVRLRRLVSCRQYGGVVLWFLGTSTTGVTDSVAPWINVLKCTAAWSMMVGWRAYRWWYLVLLKQRIVKFVISRWQLHMVENDSIIWMYTCRYSEYLPDRLSSPHQSDSCCCVFDN